MTSGGLQHILACGFLPLFGFFGMAPKNFPHLNHQCVGWSRILFVEQSVSMYQQQELIITRASHICLPNRMKNTFWNRNYYSSSISLHSGLHTRCPPTSPEKPLRGKDIVCGIARVQRSMGIHLHSSKRMSRRECQVLLYEHDACFTGWGIQEYGQQIHTPKKH